MKKEIYNIGDFTIELLSDGDNVCGIGGIFYRGTALRNGDLPWLPEFESAQGHVFEQWKLAGADRAREGRLLLRLRAIGGIGWRSPQRNCYYDRGATPLSAVREEIKAGMTLEFTADDWYGLPRLRYRVALDCPGATVLSVVERYTLEPNGTTEGACYFAPRWGSELGGWEHALDQADSFSTRDAMMVNGKPHVMGDMQPRGGGGPAMDFVYSPKLAIARFREEMTYVRGYTEKLAGNTVLDIVDEIFFTPGGARETPWVSIVVCQSGESLSLHQTHDLWASVWEKYCAGLEKTTGIPRPAPVPSIFFECWNMGTGKFFQHQQKYLDAVAATGVKRIMLHTLPHPHKGNNCCGIYDFTVLETEGGLGALRAYCNEVHQRGMEIYGWAAGHLHVSSPLLKQHPEWIVRYENGQRFGGGYAELAAIDFANPDFQKVYIKWMLDMHQAGVDGFWLDSLLNLHFYGINMLRSPEHGGPGPHVHGLLHCLRTLSKAGLRFITEGVSPLGLSAGSIGLESIAGTALTGNLLWDSLNCGEQGLYRSTLWVRGKIQSGGGTISKERYFRCLANAAPPALFYDTSDNRLSEDQTLALDPPIALPGYAAMNRAYLEVLPLLGRRELLAEDAGVLWHPYPEADAAINAQKIYPDIDEQPGPRVLFSFREDRMKVPWAAGRNLALLDVEEGTSAPMENGEISTREMGVYVIK